MTYLLRCLEPRDSIPNPFAELLRICALLFLELVRNALYLRNIPGDAPPGNMLESRVALSV